MLIAAQTTENVYVSDTRSIREYGSTLVNSALWTLEMMKRPLGYESPAVLTLHALCLAGSMIMSLFL